jgi:competence protein ComEA
MPAHPPDATARSRLAALAPGLLPETVRDGVLDPGRRGAAALVAVALAAVAVTGFVVWRGRPQPVDVPPPPRVVATAATPSAALLVVDVAGDVRRPGLVRLPPGSRVADAIAAAGGLRPGATTEGLNLARKLVDGEQVLVGAGGAAPVATGASPGVVDLNTATLADLDALPGVGPVLAQRILDWRTAHGAFASVDQLREVEGIGARRLETLRGLLTV